MSFELSIVLKATIVLLGMILLSWTLRRASASVRHAVWALGLIAVLAVPVMSPLLPSIDLPILPAVATPAAPLASVAGREAARPVSLRTHAEGDAQAVFFRVAEPENLDATDRPRRISPSIPWTWRQWVTLAWGLGACMTLVGWLAAVWELRQLKRKSRLLLGDDWPELLEEVRHALSVSESVELRIAQHGVPPMTWGIFRHVILLPPSAAEWSPIRRRLVLAHEMAHVKRNDGLGQILAQAVCSVYWFHPLAWYAVHRLHAERECACDDTVLRLGAPAADYADHLLQVARGLNSSRFAWTAVAMANTSELKSRLIAILDKTTSRRRLSRFAVTVLISTIAALVAAVGALQVTTLAAMTLPAFEAPAGAGAWLAELFTPAAQPPQRPGQQSQGGRIEGTVLRAGTTEPVAGARIAAVRADPSTGAALPVAGAGGSTYMAGAGAMPPPPNIGVPLASTLAAILPIPAVTTDDRGRFAIADLEPGVYRLQVTSNGYVRQEYGQRVSPGQGTLLKLSAGEVLKDLVLPLTQAGNVSGRLIDNFGQPVVGVPVQILKNSYNTIGQRTYQVSGNTKTNDRGEYRLYWMTPGRYLVAAGAAPDQTARFIGPNATPNPNDPVDSYGYTYYPGVADLSAASAVDVQSGGESIVNFVVRPQQLYGLRGRVLDSATGQPPPAIGIWLGFQALDGGNGAFSRNQAYNPATGAFEMRDVPPGLYILQVSGGRLVGAGPTSVSSTPAGGTGAKVPVDLTAGSVENVMVVLRSGSSIPGRMTMEGPTPTGLDRARIQLRPTSNLGIQVASSAPGAEGTFNVEGVMPGEYRVVASGLPADSYIKSIRFNGTDALNQPIQMLDSNSTPGGFEVIFSPNVGQVEGVVMDDHLQPVRGVQAVLVPDRNRDRTDLFRAVTTNQTGHFMMRNIPPGDYKLFAWEVLESYGYFDPELLRQSEAKGKSVRIGESSRQNADIQIIPAPKQ